MANEVMCPYCGEMISERATVCRHCGRLLTGSASYRADGTGDWYGSAPDGHTGEEAQRLRRRSRTILWLVITLCALLAIGFIAVFSFLIADLSHEIISDDSGDIDAIIQSITESDPSEVSGDINTVPDLPGGVISDQNSLLIDYTEALEKGDRDALAKLYHPAVQAFYENDADTMLEDLEEGLPYLGTKCAGWTVTDSDTNPLTAEELAQMESDLACDITQLEAYLIEFEPASGDTFELAVLLMETAEGWGILYTY